MLNNLFNILKFQNDMNQESTLRLKISCGNYIFLPYRLSADNNSCVITNSVKGINEESTEQCKQQVLAQRLKKILQDVEIQSK